MKINKLTLNNGLRLVHCEDTSTQMVALNVVYDVGARDEHPQHTGFAPVSYTHLDVYKRQVAGSSHGGKSAHGARSRL